MSRNRHSSVCLWLASLAVLALSATPALSQRHNPEVERVLVDWQRRRERVQCIRYTVTGESIKPKGSFGDPITGLPLDPPQPPEDISQQRTATLLLDFKTPRFRFELSEQLYYPTKRQMGPCVKTDAFDGAAPYTAIPREANTSAASERAPDAPDVSILRGASRGQKIYPLRSVTAYSLDPLLVAHGVVHVLVGPTDFDTTLEPEDVVAQGHAEHAGRPCLVLRTLPIKQMSGPSFEEFWIDTARDSAVLRQASFLDGMLKVDKQVTYQETPNGWLPLEWTTVVRDPPNKIINVARLRVQDLVADPAVTDADFQVEIRPGMNVQETIYDEPGKVQDGPGFRRAMYRVAPDGSRILLVNGVEQKRPGRWWYGAAGLALAVGALALVCYLWQRRRRARRGGHSHASA